MKLESGGNLLERLRANETLRRLSRGRPDLLIFGAPAVVLGVIAAAIVAIVIFTGGSDEKQVRAGTPTSTSGDATVSPTPGENAGLKTPVFTPGSELTIQDLAARGVEPNPPRGDFTGERLIIPKIGIDAPFTVKTVPGSGQMPNPNGPEDVAYYDFSSWPGLGGVPGKGGNIVLAGHVDYIRYGPAVFWRLHELVAGDRIQIRLKDGSIVEYEIHFNKTVAATDADWSALVAGTAPESITLITCGGEFEAGHYNNRQIVWGRRVQSA